MDKEGCLLQQSNVATGMATPLTCQALSSNDRSGVLAPENGAVIKTRGNSYASLYANIRKRALSGGLIQMTLLPMQCVGEDTWKHMLSRHGYGKAGPRYIYRVDCTVYRFPGHRVLCGPHPSGEGCTDSGFLLDSGQKVIGGVDAILPRWPSVDV